MVATSLPFWMQHPSRTMLPFLADQPAPAGLDAASRARRRLPATSGAVAVERVSGLGVEPHLAAWAQLAARAVEPNVFNEPGFAFAALLHLPPVQRPDFLLAWEPDPDGVPVLIGLLAIDARTVAVAPTAVSAWHNPQWVASAPLLDRSRGAAALDAMMGHLAARRATRGGLLLRGVPRQGALMRLVEDGGRRRVAILALRTRAVLVAPEEGANENAVSRKRAKEMRRQWRRLGGASLRTAATVDDVRAATERFLELEARGWKGGRGTALLADSHLATFTRTMTRLLAHQGLCRIHTLAVGNEPVAMGIVLRSGDRAFYWKTAFDEARRQHSPGKQLALAIADFHRADPTLALSDSCAIPDHPMIDRVWPGRMDVADVLVACPGQGAGGFAGTVVRLRFVATARQRLKAARDGLKRWLKRH